MRNTLKIICVSLVLGLFIIQPVSSYADWHGHEQGHEHWHRYGHSSFGIDLSLGSPGYYYDGPYYPEPDYVLVSPPNYQPVILNGMTYYVNNGTYYQYTGYGYQVVSQPVVVSQPATQTAGMMTAPAVTDTENSFTVNIPNNSGGYTAVIIQRSGDGFVGPQGEFYPKFPRISQLKAMYTK